MRCTHPLLTTILCLLTLATTGCPSDTDDPPADAGTIMNGDGDATGDGDGAMAGPILPGTCIGADVGYDDFFAGLEAEGEAVMVRVEDADNIPARKQENAWQVSLHDLMGNPLPDATLMNVVPMMPAHGHGSPIAAVITDEGDGVYQVERINLWMDGHWTVDFIVDVDGTEDTAQFDVCVPK